VCSERIRALNHLLTEPIEVVEISASSERSPWRVRVRMPELQRDFVFFMHPVKGRDATVADAIGAAFREHQQRWQTLKTRKIY
jgi:hypothetical protein